MAAVCTLLGIKQSHTSSYHPQGNGQVERFNRTLEAMLAKVVSDHRVTGTPIFQEYCLLIEQPSMNQLVLPPSMLLLAALLSFQLKCLWDVHNSPIELSHPL